MHNFCRFALIETTLSSFSTSDDDLFEVHQLDLYGRGCLENLVLESPTRAWLLVLPKGGEALASKVSELASEILMLVNQALAHDWWHLSKAGV